MERTIRLVKPSGRVGIVIVEGIFNTKKYGYVRDYIKRHIWINAIISLNYDTFSGYGAKATTSLLFFTKKDKPDDGRQKDIFMAICENTGYSPSGLEIPGNELPEILLNYKKFIDEGIHEFDDNRIFIIPNSELKDRLDPQHYMSQVKKIKIGLNEVVNTKEKLHSEFQDIGKIYNELFKSRLIDLNNITDWDEVNIDDLVNEYHISEILKSNQDYSLVGVRGNALGAFVKDIKKGKEIKTKKLFRTKQGCLIYNQLFAHRGSFAILNDEIYNSCYVSGEFPQFEAKQTKYESENLMKYLFYYCINPVFIDEVRRHSSGSTKMSRFRLNHNKFLNFKIKIPSKPNDLNNIVEKMDTIFVTTNKIKEKQKTLEDTIEELKKRYIMTFP